jgi:hypothetical protein
MKYKLIIRASAVISLTIATLAVTTSAHAEPAPAFSDKGGYSTINSVNKDCENAIKAANVKSREKLSFDICKVQVKTTYSDARTITLQDIQNAKASLSTSDFDSLTKAVAAGTVKSRFYLQQMIHITDSETQSGIFYFDGARAWVTTTYRGSTGSHLCVIDWAVGFGVTAQNCYESGSASERVLSQQWLMSLFLNGFPVAWSETYTMHVNAAGQAW